MSDLDDPTYSAFAWGRYRRLLAWMLLASVIAAAVAIAALTYVNGPLPLHMMIATGAGVGLSVLLAAALMGLVFLSSGSGHDDTIEDPFADLDRD